MHEDDDSTTPIRNAISRHWALFACAAFFVLAWYFFTSTASAHEAPTGWTYPYACCSGQDCREVPSASVKEMPDGYHLPSGEIVPMTDGRIRPSPDGETHLCTVAGADDGRMICLFLPPKGA